MKKNSLHNIGEVRLLEQMAAGDERAFTVLFEQYWKRVFTYLLYLTKSREIAEELLSELFTKFWLNRAAVSGINDVDAYLAKMAYNKAIDFFRIAAKEKKVQQLIASELIRHPQHVSNDYLTNREHAELLHKAIHELSPQRKLVFTLSREHGLTHEQIARKLNMSPNTVKKTMSNAIRSIRNFLQRYGLDTMILLITCGHHL